MKTSQNYESFQKTMEASKTLLKLVKSFEKIQFFKKDFGNICMTLPLNY